MAIERPTPEVLYGKSGSYLGNMQYTAGKALQSPLVQATRQQYTRDPASTAALRDYAGTLNAVGGKGIIGAQILPKQQTSQRTGGSAVAWGSTPGYNVGAAPQVSTTPWDATGGAWKQMMDGANAPQIGETDFGFDMPQGGPYMVDAEDTGMTLGGDYGLGQWVQAISDQLRYGEGSRIAAAREQQVARGMGRSGAAILSEDAVKRETELEIAQQAAAASVEQARLEQDSMKAHASLKTERDLSNQRATEAWQALNEKAEEFASGLEFQRRIANQEAQIQQSGQALQYAGILSQLETERTLANQDTQRLYAEMQMNESQFRREQDLQKYISDTANELGFAELAEQGRRNTLEYSTTTGGGRDVDWAGLASTALDLKDQGMAPHEIWSVLQSGSGQGDQLAQNNPWLYGQVYGGTPIRGTMPTQAPAQRTTYKQQYNTAARY